MIQPKDNWLGTCVASMKDEELCVLFGEIAESAEVGLLTGDTLKELTQKFSESTGQPVSPGDIRTVEYAVLYEMARRFHNSTASPDNFIEKYRCKDGSLDFDAMMPKEILSYFLGITGSEIMEALEKKSTACIKRVYYKLNGTSPTSTMSRDNVKRQIFTFMANYKQEPAYKNIVV